MGCTSSRITNEGKYEDERRWGESGSETWGATRPKRTRQSDIEETNGSLEKSVIPSPNKSMYVKKPRPRLRTVSPTISSLHQQDVHTPQPLPPIQQQPVTLEAEDLTNKKERPVSPASSFLNPTNIKEESNGNVGGGNGGGGNGAVVSGGGASTGRGSSSSTTSSKLYATCLICGKQLSNQYNLRVHMETHRNAHYACSSCSHVSRSRDALRKHVSYRHPPSTSSSAAAAASATSSTTLSSSSSSSSSSITSSSSSTNSAITNLQQQQQQQQQPPQQQQTTAVTSHDDSIHQPGYF